MFTSKQVLFSLLISTIQPCLLAKAFRREPVTNIDPDSKITVELPKDIDLTLSQNLKQVRDAPTDLGLSPRSVDFNSVLKAAKEDPSALPEACSSIPGKDATISDIVNGLICRYAEDIQCVKRAHTVEIGKRSFDLKERVDRENSDCLFNAGEAVVADMGETEYLPWLTTGPNAIGTVGLCGCTAISIISPKGAMVSHISPNPITLHSQLDKLKQKFDFNMRAEIQVYALIYSPTNVSGNLVAPDLL